MRTRVIIYVIFVCLLYFPLAGQDFWQESAVESVESVDNPASNLWWVTIGYGSGYSNGTFYLFPDSGYFGFSFSPARVSWLLTTVRGSGVCEWYGSEDVNNISVLIGAMAKGTYAYVSASSGIGYTEVYHREENYSTYGAYQGYEDITYSTVGLTFELQAFLTPTSWFGFGLVGFANVNPERSFLGVNWCIQLGRLRR